MRLSRSPPPVCRVARRGLRRRPPTRCTSLNRQCLSPPGPTPSSAGRSAPPAPAPRSSPSGAAWPRRRRNAHAGCPRRPGGTGSRSACRSRAIRSSTPLRSPRRGASVRPTVVVLPDSPVGSRIALVIVQASLQVRNHAFRDNLPVDHPPSTHKHVGHAYVYFAARGWVACHVWQTGWRHQCSWMRMPRMLRPASMSSYPWLMLSSV